MSENLQVKCVGQGGYGVVMLLKSYHPQIVMKEIVKNPKIDFQTELKVLKELSHPNIVKYVDRPSDFTYNGQNLVIFMEFCENGSLKQVISDSTLIYSIATIAKWAEEIFYALVYLFQKKKVHRDIKSANIFLTRDHIVKIGDFGIVKEFSKASHSGQPVGTFGYMAPEVLNKLVVDEENEHKCDVFGAGIVLLELIERKPLPQIDTPLRVHHDFKELVQLVENCTTVDYKIRAAPSEALKIVNLLKKKTIDFESVPERRIAQKLLVKPIGLNGTHEEALVYDYSNSSLDHIPTITFDFKSDEKAEAKIENCPGEKAVNSLLASQQQNQLAEWLQKLEVDVNFDKILLYNLEVFRDCQWIEGNFFDENNKIENFFDANNKIENFNEPRKHLSKKLIDLIKNINVEETKALFDSLHHTLIANFRLRRYLNFSFDDNGPDVPEELTAALEKVPEFSSILKYDHKIQNACFGFAFFVMRECQRSNLTNQDISKLIEMAIKNIEELEKIFSRRLYFTVFYVESSRLEWFDTEPYYHIYMRRDLTHFVDNETIKDSNGNPMYKIPIDIEAVRRSLYDHREILRRFMHRPRTEHVSMHYLLDTLEDQAKEQIPIDQLSVWAKDYLDKTRVKNAEQVQSSEIVEEKVGDEATNNIDEAVSSAVNSAVNKTVVSQKLEIIRGASSLEIRLNQLPETNEIVAFVRHFREPGFIDPFDGFYFFFNSPPEEAWKKLPLARAYRIIADDPDGLRKLRSQAMTPKHKVFMENYALFEKAWSYVLCYSTLENQLPILFLIKEFLIEIKEHHDFSFRCSYNGNKEEDEDNNFLILHPRTLTSCTVVTHDLLIERVNYTPYSLIYLKGYVNVHFSELKALLESMISLFDFEHYSHEIDEVNTAEMREEFEELRGFQNYKSTMKEVIKKFWDNMGLKLAPSMQELEAIEVIVPEISLFPAEYL